jgi:hypothetical protein
MFDYATLPCNFWSNEQGKKITKLGAIHTVLAFYVRTAPHRNMAGLYHLPMAYITADTHLKDSEVRAALKELERLDYLTYDSKTEWIFVHDLIAVEIFGHHNHKPTPGDKRMKCIAKQVGNSPSESLIKSLKMRYTHLFVLPDEMKKTRDSNDSREELGGLMLANESPSTQCALLLKERILINNPTSSLTTAWTDSMAQQWAKVFDQIHRLDGRGWEEIDMMIRFAQSHHFWHKNILSPDKLRKQWDRLMLEMEGKRDAPRSPEGSSGSGKYDHLTQTITV